MHSGLCTRQSVCSKGFVLESLSSLASRTRDFGYAGWWMKNVHRECWYSLGDAVAADSGTARTERLGGTAEQGDPEWRVEIQEEFMFTLVRLSSNNLSGCSSIRGGQEQE